MPSGARLPMMPCGPELRVLALAAEICGPASIPGFLRSTAYFSCCSESVRGTTGSMLSY
jgi:hypothetical protein